MSLALDKKPPPPDIVHNDIAGAENRLRALKGGFNKVSGKWDRRLRAKKVYRLLRVPAVAAISSFGFMWYLTNSPWPVAATLRHLAAFPNCQAAEMVGLAPSHRGQPGYWSHNDRDGDGIACKEPGWRVRHLILPAPL
jgi:hypothetical protein